MGLQRLPPSQGEAGLARVLLDFLDRRQPATGEDLGHDELDKARHLEGHRHAALYDLRSGQPGDGVQQHHAVGGQNPVCHGEEVVVAVVAEVLEGADGHDPVDGLVELFPALQ